MTAILFPLITLCHLALALWGLRILFQWYNSCLLILISNILAMAYSASVFSVERLFDNGTLPEIIDRHKYLPLDLLFPLLIYASFDMVRRIRVDWGGRRWLTAGIISLTLLLIVVRAGFVVGRNPRGSHSFFLELPIVSIITLTFVITFGLVILRRAVWPWLAVGALVMFFGMIAPVTLVGPNLRAITEILFGFSLVITERRVRTGNFDEHHNPDLH